MTMVEMPHDRQKTTATPTRVSVLFNAAHPLLATWAMALRCLERRGALAVYGVQLALNFIWTILFFGFSAYYAAFVCLMLLIGSIAWMIAAFYPVNKAAALLQLPYLVWVLFAGYLNLAIALLN